MKKRICSMLLLGFMACLVGCGKGKTLEEGEAAMLRDGDRVSRKLTDKVTLDATIELPKDWDGTVETCKVKNVYFNGKELSKRLYPDIPASEWQDPDMAEFGDDAGVLHEGDIWIEEGQEPKPGVIRLALGISIQTERAERNRRLFKQNIEPDSRVLETDAGEELTFMPMEEARERAEKYWTEVIGLEGVRFLGYYPVTHKELFEEAECLARERGETMVEEFEETDDCYDIRMEQIVNGLPLTAGSLHDGRKDGLYVPSGEIITIVGTDGIASVSCEGNYEILEVEENEAASMEIIYHTLERKFQMSMAGDVSVDEMRLVYYPYPLSADYSLREYELVPTWYFSFSADGIPSNVYVNAVTGEEITE